MGYCGVLIFLYRRLSQVNHWCKEETSGIKGRNLVELPTSLKIMKISGPEKDLLAPVGMKALFIYWRILLWIPKWRIFRESHWCGTLSNTLLKSMSIASGCLPASSQEDRSCRVSNSRLTIAGALLLKSVLLVHHTSVIRKGVHERWRLVRHTWNGDEVFLGEDITELVV